MDLAEWYAAGRWVALLDLIDMLPEASRLNEALLNDPEAAELLADEYLKSRENADPEKESDNSPRISQYALINRQMSDLTDQVKMLRQAVVASAGGTPKAEKPEARPKTGIEKAIAEAERKWASDFIQLFGFSPDDI